jgi:hypothetical protein
MSNVVKGVAPGFLLMPAREYSWELVNRVQIKILNEGKLAEVSKNYELGENLKIQGSDEFLVFDGKLLSFWEIVRVLFAGAQYPSLEDNQCLNVVGLEVDEDDNSIVLHGEIIKYVG